MTTVRCGKCNLILDEPSNVLPNERKPCPECGCTSRAFFQSAECKIGLHATAGHTVTRGATGRHTEYMTPEQQTQGRLVDEWVRCKSDYELLEHSSAHLFRQSIRGNPVVKDENLILFRGRLRDEEMGPTVEPTHFGPPPAEQTKGGRYNVTGRPVLYLSSSERGVFWELKPAGGYVENLFCQRFCLPTDVLKIADFSHDGVDNFIRIVFDYAENGTRIGRIDKTDYVFSQIVAEIVSSSGFDGMMVPGVRGSPTCRYNNVVIFSPSQWADWIDGESPPKCIDAIEQQP